MPRPKKDPNKPKGAKSAYIFFVESERAEQEKAGTTLSFSEFSKQCGERWGDMDDEGKGPYVKLSETDKRRYEKEMRSYIPPQRDSDSDSDDAAPRRKKKKKKDPNAPKRPISAYFFFASNVRPGIREENPDMSITDVAQIIGEKWRGLSESEKEPFQDQAEKDKKRYECQMEQYHQERY